MHFSRFIAAIFLIIFYFVGKFAFSFIWRATSNKIDEIMYEERERRKSEERRNKEDGNPAKIIGFRSAETTVCMKKEES